MTSGRSPTCPPADSPPRSPRAAWLAGPASGTCTLPRRSSPCFAWPGSIWTRNDPAGEFDRLRRLHDEWKAVRDRLHLVPLKSGTVADYAQSLHNLLLTQSINVAFLAMAVSDYEPAPVAGKVSSDESELIVRCRRTPKVIRSVRDWAPSIYLVGFKLLSRATTTELIRQAEASGRINRADLTVANDLQSLIAGRHTVHLVRTGHLPETLDRVPTWPIGLLGSS